MFTDNKMLLDQDLKTKLDIMHAVNKPLNKIFVKDICRNANISRDVFYRHFYSKFDISIWYGKFAQSFYLDNAGRTVDLQTAYYHNFCILSEQKEFFVCAYTDFDRMIGEFSAMNLHRKGVLLETLTAWRGLDVGDDLMFCIESFVQLETILVSRWLRDGCLPDPKTFANQITMLVPELLREALALD
ncbi:MAG: hypothetical protein RRZ85_07080 [Gordonibacter sp.]|uniref:hypothetical protein n=1 Tax=Gordonibacter sp. TaxID=1968902 RepID=UPI002FCC4BBA